MSQIEATVDVCLHLSGIRNLGEDYLGKSYFRISVWVGGNVAAPYQIIPHSNISTISITEYISPLFTLAPHVTILLQELAVFKVLVPVAELEEAVLEVRVEMCEAGTQEAGQVAQLEYAGAVDVNSYLPLCFSKSRCAIDAAVVSQFLSCRFRNILAAPKTLLYNAVERLLIAFNRLRERASKAMEGCEYAVESFPEMEEVRKFARARIFQQAEQEQRVKLLEFERKLPRVSFCVQQLWGKFLAKELHADVEKYRKNFVKSYALQVKHRVERQGGSQDLTIVDGLKLPSCPLAIKTIAKSEAEEYEEKGEEVHLLFLVHGFGASSKTLEQLELAFCFLFPHVHVLTSKVNENRTDDDLHEMGRRLALEVQASLEALHVKDNFSLSFVAHSMGGLIVRAALPLLERHRFSMRLYVSLGTPHLGYLFHNSSLTKAGMWAYQLLRHSPAMATLLMRSPSSDPRQAVLYELSRTPGLQWFEQVLLYAASGDYYVSDESALMESNEAIREERERGEERGMLWEEMRNNLDEALKGVPVGKYLVDFERENQMNEGSMADELLGRRNHMNLATSGSFVLALVLALSSVF